VARAFILTTSPHIKDYERFATLGETIQKRLVNSLKPAGQRQARSGYRQTPQITEEAFAKQGGGWLAAVAVVIFLLA
jgi:hypothetical protein